VFDHSVLIIFISTLAICMTQSSADKLLST